MEGFFVMNVCKNKVDQDKSLSALVTLKSLTILTLDSNVERWTKTI